jgi:hypothetical protein
VQCVETTVVETGTFVVEELAGEVEVVEEAEPEPPELHPAAKAIMRVAVIEIKETCFT